MAGPRCASPPGPASHAERPLKAVKHRCKVPKMKACGWTETQNKKDLCVHPALNLQLTFSPPGPRRFGRLGLPMTGLLLSLLARAHCPSRLLLA